MRHPWNAGHVVMPLLIAASATGCFQTSPDPFVVDLTVDLGAIEVPARLDVEIVELDAPGGATLSTRLESQNGPDFFATKGGNRLIVTPSPDAGAIRVRATAFDAAGTATATGVVEVTEQARTVEATIYLVREVGDAGVPDGG